MKYTIENNRKLVQEMTIYDLGKLPLKVVINAWDSIYPYLNRYTISLLDGGKANKAVVKLNEDLHNLFEIIFGEKFDA